MTSLPFVDTLSTNLWYHHALPLCQKSAWVVIVMSEIFFFSPSEAVSSFKESLFLFLEDFRVEEGYLSIITLEGLVLKLKLQSFDHMMWTTNSLEKTLMLGKIEGRRRRELLRMRWLDGITDPNDMSLSKLREIVKDRKAWCAAIHGIAKRQTQLSDWTKQQSLFTLSKLSSSSY